MLRRDHPMTPHIFRASHLMDSVMICGQEMSVSPSAVRAELLAECLPRFVEMRELAWMWFADEVPFILAAVDEYEAAIRALASLGGGQITEDRRDGKGACPVCATPIPRRRKSKIVLCGECAKPYMTAYSKLDSSEGFSTWLI